MCCGQKRAEIRNNSTSSATSNRQPLQQIPPQATVGRSVSPVNSHRIQSHAPRPSIPSPGPTASRPAASVAAGPLVRLRYVESSPIRVLGPSTGRHYEFSASHTVQSVDPSDASILLQSRFFRRS